MAPSRHTRSPRAALRAVLVTAGLLAAALQPAAAGTTGLRLQAAASLHGPAAGRPLPLGIAAALADELAGATTAAASRELPPHLIHPVPPQRTAGPAPADEAAGGPSPPEKPYGWARLRHDLPFVARKPANLSSGEKWSALAVSGTTVALYVFREDIREAWQDSSSDSRTDFLNSSRIMGGAGFAPAVAFAAWAASQLTDNEREREAAQLVLESWAMSAAVAGIGSFVLAAERPEDGNNVELFSTEGRGVSVDVALAASVIPPLRRQYLRVQPGDGTGRRILKHGISALLYSGMVLVALQRIDADKHWAPDVFLGAVTGLAVGGALNQAHDEAQATRSQVHLEVLPGGLVLTWNLNLGPT